MAETSEGRRRGSGKRAMAAGDAAVPPVMAPAPCGACKFLRRKCMSGCIFAPHFGTDQGAARFAAVHKVFGASNVSKLLLHIPVSRRSDAVVTISYEAQARLSDPVYGCVSTILALQQQLLNSRLAVANAFQNTEHHQHQHHHHIAGLQPSYSNHSSNSHHLGLLNTGTSNFNSNFDLVSGGGETAPSSHSFEPLPVSRPREDQEDEEEDESRDPVAFADQILRSR
ncbi:hypothetical protein RHGRI_006733 [Rhododendron griersonianum]|uniref:LOB domain-containing protein n=1 Tax=Rhododendron griersonianum TaxID=479676 RepID=A0AAV6KVE7_9ERIC|nr:hypothetical protein RHGRI_006733 [Rhododendron griersonianum]